MCCNIIRVDKAAIFSLCNIVYGRGFQLMVSVPLRVSATFQGVRSRPFFYPIYKVIYLKMGSLVGTKHCYLFIRGQCLEKVEDPCSRRVTVFL